MDQEYPQQEMGFDEFGNQYQNIEQMWNEEFDKDNKKGLKEQVGGKSDWYRKGGEYWDNEPSTVNGNLGGFEQLHPIDIEFSRETLDKLVKEGVIRTERALDCGAGIGRVTQHLLSQVFQKVDLVDQCSKYINEAKELMKHLDQVEHYYVQGLQGFTCQHQYSCVWVQWVIGQIIDDDFVDFLINCKYNLLEGGTIVIKDNVTKQGFVVSKDDFSVCRSQQLLFSLFQKAGLKVVYQVQQPGFPKELFKVFIYVLKPIIH